jgi:hypothetical protein
VNTTPVTEEELAQNAKAPRVTPDQIEASIKAEHYFTAYEGVLGERFARKAGESDAGEGHVPKTLNLMTFCVLTMQNGYTVVGQSASASFENFDPDIGRRLARQNAVNQIWPLLGYQLRDRLHSLKTKEPAQ